MSESEIPAVAARQVATVLPPKARESLKAARVVFLEAGYDGATMDAIARVAAISKATLYAHFPGKAALFEELIRVECRAVNARLYVPDPQNASVEAELRTVVDNYRRIFTQREGLDIFRILIPVAPRFPRLVQVFYEEGPGAAIRQIAAYLAALDRAGHLRIPDPELAAHQLLALISEDARLSATLSLPPLPESQAEPLIASGIAMFLTFYKA